MMITRFSTLVIVCSAAAFAAPATIKTIASRAQAVRSDDDGACVIKGNISVNTGERIYHVPGQKYYLPTRISHRFGERWFCSEADARAAGWRRARR
ncbi:MAG: succinoglycan biosynthesis protein exoi [Hoeflea sp.]|uniref:sunset domain-containing protein n=1 Tax=Hoeflea sp. TaxID=1940281 RepID=UPI003298B1F6